MKLIEGTQGVGVVLAETKKAAESVIDAFRELDANILVQEFIKEAGGRRHPVPSSSAAGSWPSMKRQGAPGEFRSNLHRGGTAEKVKLTPEERSHGGAGGQDDGPQRRPASTCCAPTTGRW